MNPAVLQALEQGASVISATRRLSYELKSAYDQHQISLGKKVWPTARVHSWDGWMQVLWINSSAYTSQSCLSNAQLQQLLSDIVELDLKSQNSKNEHGMAALWNIPATARTALEAWQLCHQWRISYTALQTSEQPDHVRFGRWATKLYARLQEQNWVSPAQIADVLIENKFQPEQDVILVGFDYLNAQQTRFIAFFRDNGINITQLSSDKTTATQIKHCAFDSPELEWQHIGAWAREKLLKHPELKIGIITPDTEKIRPLAEKALREQLTPGYFIHDTVDPFHFSWGGKLIDHPLISNALACLGLLGDIEFNQLSSVFLSNYWGSEIEQNLRAQLAISLRRKIAYRFDLYEFIETLSTALNKADNSFEVTTTGATLLEKLNSLQATKADNRGKQSLSTWHKIFRSCLHTLGWPAINLNSSEFQAMQAWERCLEEWVRLDTVCQPVSLVQALQSLNSFCRETTFQAQAQEGAPVQIMGVLEAAELDFDLLWLAGFDEQAWPAPASANPFIPVSTQRDAGIPDASLSLQAELANKKTAQLFALCNEIIYSHARIQGDIKLGVSPILSDMSHLEHPLPASIFSINEAIRLATPVPEPRNDDIGFPCNENTTRGGTGLVQKQSACPFQAYACYRLKADEDEAPQIGMDSLARGSLLHKVLEVIWQELQDSRALCEHIQRGTLKELIHRHTQEQLNIFPVHSGLGEGFSHAETQRLDALVAEWLKLEAQRPAFKVEATELKLQHAINGLNLSFTLDRVDQLATSDHQSRAEDSRLIMDYKSGNCELKDWTGERPGQPQMPLYFLALGENRADTGIDALSYAQIKPGLCRFIGISRLQGTLPEVKSLETLGAGTSLKKEIREWSQLKAVWEARIKKIVGDYQQGLAHVDPKSASSCTFCNFAPLCRIHTRDLQEGG
ncbi:MAG: hypothetical protein GY726_06265, partial [Proteobacteria bacterium]|nr:hypothetical protein [Pseudomonadota bacterium]